MRGFQGPLRNRIHPSGGLDAMKTEESCSTCGKPASEHHDFVPPEKIFTCVKCRKEFREYHFYRYCRRCDPVMELLD